MHRNGWTTNEKIWLFAALALFITGIVSTPDSEWTPTWRSVAICFSFVIAYEAILKPLHYRIRDLEDEVKSLKKKAGQ